MCSALLGELPNLRRLELQGNRLTGALPRLAPERTREKLELLLWIRDGLQPDERIAELETELRHLRGQ